jgi:hypothetical protein
MFEVHESKHGAASFTALILQTSLSRVLLPVRAALILLGWGWSLTPDDERRFLLSFRRFYSLCPRCGRSGTTNPNRNEKYMAEKNGSLAGSKEVKKQTTGSNTVTTDSYNLQNREGGGNFSGGKRCEAHGQKKAHTIPALNNAPKE